MSRRRNQRNSAQSWPSKSKVQSKNQSIDVENDDHHVLDSADVHEEH